MMKDKTLLCPLKFGGQNFFAQSPECEKENCAWWCDWDECCALTAIPAEINDRMHDLQVTLER